MMTDLDIRNKLSRGESKIAVIKAIRNEEGGPLRDILNRVNRIELQIEQETPVERQMEELKGLYKRIGIPLDRLPYTSFFEELFADFVALVGPRNGNTGERWTQAKVWFSLQALRKAGKLPRVGRKA
jgi:hypothetical protein